MVGALLSYSTDDSIQAKGGGSTLLHKEKGFGETYFPLIEYLIYYSRLTVSHH